MKSSWKKKDKEMNNRIHITLSEKLMKELRFLSARENGLSNKVWDFQRFIYYAYRGFPTNIRYNPYSRCMECDIVYFKDF